MSLIPFCETLIFHTLLCNFRNFNFHFPPNFTLSPPFFLCLQHTTNILNNTLTPETTRGRKFANWICLQAISYSSQTQFPTDRPFFVSSCIQNRQFHSPFLSLSLSLSLSLFLKFHSFTLGDSRPINRMKGYNRTMFTDRKTSTYHKRTFQAISFTCIHRITRQQVSLSLSFLHSLTLSFLHMVCLCTS